MKRGLGSYSSEVVVDEDVEFSSGEKPSQLSVPGHDSRSTQNENCAVKSSDQQQEIHILPNNSEHKFFAPVCCLTLYDTSSGGGSISRRADIQA
jgi:hypothetical protein